MIKKIILISFKDTYPSSLVDNFLSKSIKTLIFKHKENYISMLLETPKSYVYCEKFYNQSYPVLALSIEIFKDQKYKKFNFNQLRMVITNQFYDEYFNEKLLTNFLKKNKVYYHRWHENGSTINTSSSL